MTIVAAWESPHLWILFEQGHLEMDFNYYLQRYAISRRQAEATRSAPAREAHEELAEAYRRLIEFEQRKRGAAFLLTEAGATGRQ